MAATTQDHEFHEDRKYEAGAYTYLHSRAWSRFLATYWVQRLISHGSVPLHLAVLSPAPTLVCPESDNQDFLAIRALRVGNGQQSWAEILHVSC